MKLDKRSKVMILGAVAGVAVVGMAGGGIYYANLTAPVQISHAVPSAPKLASVLTSSSSSKAQFRAYSIVASRSSASYETYETRFAGGGNSVVGTTSAIAGNLAVGLTNPSATRVGTIVVDISQLQSDSSMRDNAIRRAWLESATYPLATFKNIVLHGIPSTWPSSGTIPFTASGDLTIHATTRHVTWTMRATLHGATLTIDATSPTMKMTDFSVQPPTNPVLQVVNKLTLHLHLVATPSGGTFTTTTSAPRRTITITSAAAAGGFASGGSIVGRVASAASGALTLNTFQGPVVVSATTQMRIYRLAQTSTAAVVAGTQVSISTDSSTSPTASSIVIIPAGAPAVQVQSFGGPGGGSGAGTGMQQPGTSGSGNGSAAGGSSGMPGGRASGSGGAPSGSMPGNSSASSSGAPGASGAPSGGSMPGGAPGGGGMPGGGAMSSALAGQVTATHQGSLTVRTAHGATTVKVTSSTTVYELMPEAASKLARQSLATAQTSTVKGHQVATVVVDSGVSGPQIMLSSSTPASSGTTTTSSAKG